MSDLLVELENLTKKFSMGNHEIIAVDNVSIDVSQGECLAIVGESGSGKSTIANMILGIYPPTSGTISYRNSPLPNRRNLSHKRDIQLVQQNPLSSLNPKRSVGSSLRLALDVHDIGKRSSRNIVVGELLEEVGLPAEFAKRAPSSLSGGQRQRVAIARALACESELVVLDEPTSALDVLVQARVLKLLTKLKQKRNLTYIFITHDLCVVRNIANRVAVFEKGKLVEVSDTEKLFINPKAEYTRNLISAVPVVTKEEQILREKLSRRENAQI